MDGTVQCFTGGHAALGLLAIVTLGLSVAIIPLSLLYTAGILQVVCVHTHCFGVKCSYCALNV